MRLLNHLATGAEPPPSRFARLDEPRYRREVVEQFHYLYYHAYAQTWMETYWLGVPVHKCPLDLWIYQEIIVAERPDVIIETGTYRGGSALYLSTMCDVVNRGRVYTIDVNETPDRPEHPRLEYLVGSSTSDEIFAAVQHRIRPGERVLVILDSDHSREHVRRELERYSAFTDVGAHLIVEDTNVNAHPVYHSFGPGPMEAVHDFLADHPEFSIDHGCEKFFLTFNPRGYLRRNAPSSDAPKPPRPRPAAPVRVDRETAQQSVLERHVRDLIAENETLRTEIRHRDTHAAARQAADAERDRYTRSLEQDLSRIYGGKLWKTISGLRKFGRK
jgi:cephalosporin hydroxylase